MSGAKDFLAALEQAVNYIEGAKLRDEETRALVRTLLDENAKLMRQWENADGRLKFLYARYDYLFTELKKLKGETCD